MFDDMINEHDTELQDGHNEPAADDDAQSKTQQDEKKQKEPTTTKRELVERIARRLGYTQKATREIVQMFLDEITKELQRGHKLEFRDFGVFRVVKRKQRIARNPRTACRCSK